MPIETKFHAPRQRKEWVERAELIQYLVSAHIKVVIIDAPAGSGKTILAAQWRASAMESRPFAWLSLDQGDNDPSRLWWYIVEALRRACPELEGEGTLPDPRGQDLDIEETVLPGLVNRLAALSGPVVLMLDDYHLVTESRCHQQMTFLLLHLPPTVQLVIITRSEPPLPLARLRAAGEMIELRGPELSFAPAEAASLVETVSAVKLSKPDLDVLVEHTEGWPAGLHLAALSLRGHSSPSDFVRQFTGSNRFVADFLAEEVLSRLPAEMRQFLARTAILDRFCAPLCDAVAGSADAADVIDILERQNLFIVPLDEIRQWFRYHHLFAQMLRGYLVRTEPDIVSALHGRASAWYRRSGSVGEAIDHALAAGDNTAAISLMASHWYAYVDSGQVATVRGWMRMLGDAAIAAEPVAAHCAAWAAALSGDRESVRRWIPVMAAARHEEPLPDGIRSLKSSVALLRCVYGFDGLRVMHESAETAVMLENDPTSPWYALARAALGFSLYLSGDAAAAEGALEQAVSSDSAIPTVHMLSLSILSLATVELGRLPRALALAHAARAVMTGTNLSRTPQGSLAYTAAGAVYAAQGRLREARTELEHAVNSRRRVPGISQWETIVATTMLARVLLDLGDGPGAAALVDEARLLLTSSPDGAEVQLARLDLVERRLARGSRATSLAQPLTERELVVLHQLQGPHSLREIGWELHLSANTIKTHVQAIYRKLGVSTRRDAVEQGRRAGLL